MKYDFDRAYERRGTNSLKFDSATDRGKPEDILPLWVADMDFRAPEEVLIALKDRAEHGIFGYSEPDDGYFEAIGKWFLTRHGWRTDARKFIPTCGVVFSICTLIRALTEAGDAVIICQPVYYPFADCVKDNGRRLVVSELVHTSEGYVVDYEDFERKIRDNGVKLFILCNPHNPVGRVWTREELERLGDICLKNGVFVIADEIHSDFVYGGNRHTVFPTVKKEFENICAVCTAPTKTFNLAGLHNANTYIYDDEVRRRFVRELEAQGYSQSNIMGLDACKAAYAYGGEWLDELKAYLAGNLEYVRWFLVKYLPEIKLCEPQGTYLLWLDFKSLNLSDIRLKEFMQNSARVWLDDGYIFGAGGSGFQRINIACPRSTLETAMERIKSAVYALQDKDR